MKNFLLSLLLLTLLLGACSTKNSTPEPLATKNPTPTSDSVATKDVVTEAIVPAREAILSEVENNVLANVSSSSEVSAASNGSYILETGNIETSDNSRARLDLIPDGTIIRVGPNSSFTLTALIKENNEPKTKIELLFGQIFILLNGGSLDVKTPAGVASVRGSLMSVTYSPNLNHTTATCLEGHCIVEDQDEIIELTEGQAADFIDGELNDTYRDMTFEELGLWVLDNPDLQDHINEFPEIPGLPENFDWNYDFTNDPEFQFFYDPTYDPGEQIFEPGFDSLNNNDGNLPLPDPNATFDPGLGNPPGPGDGIPPGDGDPPGPG